MAKQSKFADPDVDLDNALTVPTEAVCFIIIKAREFDAKDVSTVSDVGSNPSDDGMVEVLEDRRDDPVVYELTSFIAAMTEDEQIDLVALAWLGRDDYIAEDWPSVREEATRAHTSYGKRTAAYLLGMPLLADYLEQGLSLLGLSCSDLEAEHL